MKKAIDSLLSDHKMIRKLLENLTLENPRFKEVTKTLHRVVLSHAWFEDEIFLPAFKQEPRLEKRYLGQLMSEHKDIEYFSSLIQKNQPTKEWDGHLRQYRAILTTHLKKEEDALFPLAEIVLGQSGLDRIGSEMERRQGEVQMLFNTGK